MLPSTDFTIDRRAPIIHRPLGVWKGVAIPLQSEWLVSVGDKLERNWDDLHARLYALAQPRRIARLRALSLGLAALWLIFTVAGLLWQLLPPATQVDPVADLVNPLQADSGAATAVAVDLDRLLAWNLFGTPAEAPAGAEQTAAPATASVQSSHAYDVVEERAKPTRLPLRLRGVVASSEAQAAVAIIEIQERQQQYSTGDRLPLSGAVTVAGIRPNRVVLNHNGNYELLPLYEANGTVPGPPPQPRSPTTTDQRDNAEVTRLAGNLRRRLYRDPQSLADVVNVAAVWQDDQLLGYRVSPGRDRAQLEQLGFRTGDLVTGVNGIELTGPGKAMELYRVLREAREASVELQRDGERFNIEVSFAAD